MANPNIATPSSVLLYEQCVNLTTATAENVLGNLAGSGKIVSFKISVWNIDGSNDANVTISKYDQDGTPIADNTGIDQATVGTDVVAGSSLGGPKDILVAATGGIQEIYTGRLMEDQSVVVTASNSNDISVQISYEVLS